MEMQNNKNSGPLIFITPPSLTTPAQRRIQLRSLEVELFFFFYYLSLSLLILLFTFLLLLVQMKVATGRSVL
jgi:hypothetical protein